MKHNARMIFAILLAGLLLCAASCKKNDPTEGSDTLPDTIETVVTDEITNPVTSPDPGVNPAPTVSSVQFPASKLPDYAKYTTASRIKEVLGAGKTYSFTLGGGKYYANGELKAGVEGIITRNADGTLTLDAAKIGSLIGRTDLTGSTPEEIAKSLGMGVAVYDYKLVLFYEGNEPLHTYDDLYTYEAMHLYMTDASDEDIVNAFIDLPGRISNDENNTIFYTAPDLNLGIQTSIYYAQMGQTNGLNTAPALVAGEGKHTENFTTVRVFNNQNACTTQFLAFDVSVKGGVQVAAARVGEDTLIATAPFAAHKGTDGDVRVFDTFGLLRMTIDVRDVIPGPHTIVTGHFAEGVSDEVLLVASQTTNEKGELPYVLISLADGSVISTHTLDCSFALTEKAGAPVQITVRESATTPDSLVLYFHTVQAVYEGNAQKAEFTNAEVTLPADATGVSASNVVGQKYLVALPSREGQEDISYMTVYDGTVTEGRLLDVGFYENRFYSTAAAEYNDDQYVSKGTFAHLRMEYSAHALDNVWNCADDRDIDQWFDSVTYSDYTSSSIGEYVDRLSNEYLMLEPCFTHRWHKTNQMLKLVNYVEPYTGINRYTSLDQKGAEGNYVELDSEFLTGTYADGILELAKLRIYPLRSFVQATATAFRGEGANPEHLIAMSPVHEQEICVGNSVGDYNHYMIEGFRSYMLERYGSVENLNRVFGTSFTTRDSIDPPRDMGRGDWDAYAGDYFTEWSMYNRYIVSKRIMEAYREALLAGYPPESITAHQIPEGEAVSGFLGQADTRLSPIDVVLTCGTAYGGTRYGLFYGDPTNLVMNASKMGHFNMTLGEYSSMSGNANDAYNQLQTLWKNGVKMLHTGFMSDENGVAEQAAIQKFQAENQPRPGYTGGTTNAMGVQIGGKTYNIVQIGAGSDSESVGLLKSIDTRGNWEGSVYLVPFHTKVTPYAIDALNTSVEGTANTFSTGALIPSNRNFKAIKNSDQVEITFTAAKTGSAAAWVTVEVYHGETLLTDSVTTYQLTDTMTPYRFVLANQLYENDLEIRITFHNEAGDGSMAGIKLENLRGTLLLENAGFRYYDGGRVRKLNVAHQGGVTFDLLDRELKN